MIILRVDLKVNCMNLLIPDPFILSVLESSLQNEGERGF